MHELDMTTLLLELAMILLLARVAGWAFTKLGQPAVVGEIMAGILLGPSLLGPELSETLFPLDTRPYLKLLASIGLVLFMFVVGLELDLSLIRGRGRVAGSVSIASILLPFTAGIGLAAYLATEHNAGGSFWPFALFIGASMSVTAFPVLARILTDRRIHRTETGGLALACAATDDVLAWTLLAVVISIAGGSAAGGGDWVVGLAVPFVLVALFVIRPQLRRLTAAYDRAGRLTPTILAVVLLGILTFSAATEYLHVHFIFGAFLFGAIMPQENAAGLRHEILVRLEQLSVLLLLPVFFLVSGLNVNLRGLSAQNLIQLAAILGVAIGGKYLGAYAGARLAGVPHWQANSLGILMNTRGLTELVILNVGRELGLIADPLFTMLVVMAIVTTVMTGPLMTRAYPARRVARDIALAERAALGEDAGSRVLLIVDAESDNLARLDLTLALVADQRPVEIVVAALQEQKVRRLDVGTGLSDDLVRLTAAMERSQGLVERGRQRGAAVRIVAHPSADVVGDLVELVEVLVPELVVIQAGHPATDRVQQVVDCPCVIAAADDPALADAIEVAAGTGADGDAAVVYAARMAATLDLPLVLDPAGTSDRRIRSLTEQLSTRGVRLSSSAEVDLPYRVAAPDSPAAAGAEAKVHAEPDATPVNWATVDLGRSAATETG